MANSHPNTHTQTLQNAGAYRERHVLRILQDGLPPNFDVFHNLPWSVMVDGSQQIGEVDIAVVGPGGHILLIEVKAGPVLETPQKLLKDYGTPAQAQVKDIGAQVRRQHTSLLTRMQSGDLPTVQLGSLLVLPDHRIAHGSLAYPRERIVDATEMDQLCQRVKQSMSATHSLGDAQRQQVIDFLADRFNVMPDVSTHIGQIQQTNTQLASGMAQWVPHVQHSEGVYVIEATAGSGKTQLALSLLQQSAKTKQRARYVCFNRPLADHLAQLAPSQVDVTTFHQLCRDHADRCGLKMDFADPAVFDHMVQNYLHRSDVTVTGNTPTLDLLVIDESQDIEPAWLQAMMDDLKPNARLYIMGDCHQKLYEREEFGLSNAVHIQCMDNFRSPRQVVHTINALRLIDTPIVPRSAYEGHEPRFHEYGPGLGDHASVLQRCLQNLWQEGLQPEQVAVLSYKGVQNSHVLTQAQLGGHTTRRYTGQFSPNGNPRWTDGPLLVESLYRFKGQSMPAVVLCEVDFDTLTPKDRHKLFVGLTRAQLRVEVVLSTQAAKTLGAEL